MIRVGKEVVGKGLQKLGDRGDRAVQPGDDRAGALGVKERLRQRQQFGKVSGGKNLAHPRGHHVADVAAEVARERARQVRGKQPHRQPQHGARDRAGCTGGAVGGAKRLDDRVRGLLEEEWGD